MTTTGLHPEERTSQNKNGERENNGLERLDLLGHLVDFPKEATSGRGGMLKMFL